jgi:membrane-bound serine protease (ClpP class)
VQALVAARRGPVVSGREQLLGCAGEVLQDFETDGRIRIRGEIWNALARQPMRSGDRVKVTAVEGLTLHVEPDEEDAP